MKQAEVTAEEKAKQKKETGGWFSSFLGFSEKTWTTLFELQKGFLNFQNELMKKTLESLSPEAMFDLYKKYMNQLYEYVGKATNSFQEVLKMNLPIQDGLSFLKKTVTLYQEQLKKIQEVNQAMLSRILENTQKSSEDFTNLLKTYNERLQKSFEGWQKILDEIRTKIEETVSTGTQSYMEIGEYFTSNFTKWWDSHLSLWKNLITEYQEIYKKGVESSFSSMR